jgi:hypothetical protein
LLGLLLPLRTAHAAPSLTVAIHAPWSGAATPDERHAVAQRIEQALESAGLGPAAVSSYGRLADFRRALATGAVDLVIIDSRLAPLTGFTTVASWSSGSPWVLAGNARTPKLAGLRLALAAADDPSSLRHAARLLRGQARPSTWSKIVGAPVTADARQAVTRGAADAVFLPAPQAAGMVVLAELGSVGELVIATAARRTDLARAADIAQEALRGARGGTWTAGPPALPRAVGPTGPMVANPTSPLPPLTDIVPAAPAAPPPLVLEDLWMGPDGR